ncbi:hypothetical protein [Glycomyces sp. YM15]|uniref:hypothetical protein n=1 Tax=Glycomyces sp. YM15 TaxID=2800446 RepID=UPI0019653D55|nr:hypothetical protein [Glycomyces sp. YM15]
MAVLTGESECSWHVGCDPVECYEPRARAIVAALRPLIGAAALRWVAAERDRWAGYCCHDHMAEVVMTAADEIASGTAGKTPVDADDARRERQAQTLRSLVFGLDWDSIEPFLDDGADPEELTTVDAVTAFRSYVEAQAAALCRSASEVAQ